MYRWGEDTARDERVLKLEAKANSLEESLEALADENAELKGEIAILHEHLDDRDARLEELEEVVSKRSGYSPVRSSGPRVRPSGCRCRRATPWKGPSGLRRIPEARCITSTTPGEKTARFW